MPKPYDTHTTADVLVADYSASIAGKTILITGVTLGGLGAAFAESIVAARPALLIITGRSSSKLQEAAKKINELVPDVKVKPLELDLNSLDAVRKSVAELNSWDDVPKIDVALLNAGVMATLYGVTTDGFERQFGVNHLAHFLFVNGIMRKIMKADEPRVVAVTSNGHRLNPIRWFDYNFEGGKTYNKWHAYGQSKTANMLMALSLAEKLGPKGLVTASVHPGAVEGTALGAYCDMETDYPLLMAADKALGNPEGWDTEFDFKSQQRGVAPFVFAAFDPSLKDHNGAYCLDSRIGDPLVDTIKPWGTSLIEAERLWKLSEKLVGQEFKY